MNTSTFERLQKIHRKFGAQTFGRIAQKLRALAFHEAGFSHIVEREVQGVDLEAANANGKRYALEVKTTEEQLGVSLSKENIDALIAKLVDGYILVIAALRIKMFEDWAFAAIHPSWLEAGPLRLIRLRPYRLKELESTVCPAFERVVEEHYDGILNQGEQYLIGVLSRRRLL